MKPETNTLSELFRADVRYMVPLYQRPYVWRKDTHWRPLWQDVVDVVERQADPSLGTASHFLGAVVLDHQQTTPGEVTQRLVIDGQQRLTTLQLLLSAVAAEADHANAAREARLLRALILNDEDVASGDARFKVWPILRGAPDAISTSAYGLGSDRVRTPGTVNALPGSGPVLDWCAPHRRLRRRCRHVAGSTVEDGQRDDSPRENTQPSSRLCGQRRTRLGLQPTS